ncbi:unnamed protein product [Toxocara canis]|uniref:Pre-rRNA-processing protein TSR2 homolog n=1 Tax=Toxocara canis TaxID=6265 RepID=A0A183V6K3_TOXCA|nr:unnamed protein product [Toxocara canis]
MEDSWKKCVERLLRSWTGYQLALKLQCAGLLTNEKALWFTEVLADYVAKTQSLQEEDLIDWIDDILYVDFDLVLEDNSSEWIANSLLKCIQWVKKGEQSQLNDFLTKLPSDTAVEQATAGSRLERNESDYEDEDENMNDEEESENEQQKQTPEVSVSKKNPSRRTVTDEDGWTTILPRK